MKAITAEDFLSVNGEGKLVNRRGESVLLRGVNLGGWLLQESWMCPVNGKDKVWANWDSLEELRTRGFTDEQIQTVFDTYQDNWLTEYDLDIIAKTGVNSVRLPFWYRNFMKDEKGTWITDSIDTNPGIKRLDWAIEECGKRGIYVILDMHGCPGGQCMAHCCGIYGKVGLYTDERNRELMKELWQAIAGRYKGNPVVAAYDIMNEPQNNDDYDPPKGWGALEEPSWRLTNRVYREMVRAIRAVDPDHTITLEGIWNITNIPDPRVEGWTNMMYQVHLYDNTEEFRMIATFVAEICAEYGVAAYVGEFWNMDGIAICEDLGIHWNLWTYKAGKLVGGCAWVQKDAEKGHTQRDSFDELVRKWGAPLRTENGFIVKEDILARLKF